MAGQIEQDAELSDFMGKAWLACSDCNGFKGDRVAALDPMTGESVS